MCVSVSVPRDASGCDRAMKSEASDDDATIDFMSLERDDVGDDARTVVRVKRKRSCASARALVLEIAPATRGGGGRGGDGDGDYDARGIREAQRRRASALAAALDAVLEGGSAATPYATLGDDEDDDEGGEDEDGGGTRGTRATTKTTRRRKFARVASAVSADDVEDGSLWAFTSSGKRSREDGQTQRDDAAADARREDVERYVGKRLKSGEDVRVYDVLYDRFGNAHTGKDEIRAAEEAEAVLMCNYMPMVREYLSETGAAPISPPPTSSVPDAGDDDDDWVYDVYVYDKDNSADDTSPANAEEEHDGEFLPVIRVKDFQDDGGDFDADSDYGDSDSNAEDYYGADYPDTESDDDYDDHGSFRNYRHSDDEDRYDDEDEF